MLVVDDIINIATIYSASESTLGKLYHKNKSQIHQLRNEILNTVKQEQEDCIRRFFDDQIVIQSLQSYKESGTYDESLFFRRFEIACDNSIPRPLKFNTLWKTIRLKNFIIFLLK